MSLRHRVSTLPIDDDAYRRLVYSNIPCDRRLRCAAFNASTDLVDWIIRIRPLSLARSALRDHVGHVVRVRSEEEMRRVHARWVVAVMANKYRQRRQFAGVDEPRQPVSEHLLVSVADDPIATPIASPVPGPAVGWRSLADEGPESFSDRDDPCAAGARKRTEDPAPPADITPTRSEGTAA